MAIQSSLSDIQKTLYRILRTDDDLKEMVTGVFDEIQPKHPYPYIVFGEFTEVNFHTFDRDGREVNLDLHIFSEYKGNKEINEIANRVIELLDYKGVEIDNLYTVFVRYNTGNTIREPSGPGVRRHFIMDFNVIVQEKKD